MVHANDQTVKGGKDPAQMNKELLIKLERKKKRKIQEVETGPDV